VFANASVRGRFGVGSGASVVLDSSPPSHGRWMCGECQAMRQAASLRNGADFPARCGVRDALPRERGSSPDQSFRASCPWGCGVLRRTAIWPIRRQNLKYAPTSSMPKDRGIDTTVRETIDNFPPRWFCSGRARIFRKRAERRLRRMDEQSAPNASRKARARRVGCACS
jgi:hypothetical protein